MNVRTRSKSERTPSLETIDPRTPTEAYPGSAEKIEMLRLRNAEGLPLWHPSDRNDHGPRRHGAKDFAA